MQSDIAHAQNHPILLVGPSKLHWFSIAQEIILVEGLKLDNVPAGMYNVHCLPLRLVGAEGSPIRCILMKNWVSRFIF